MENDLEILLGDVEHLDGVSPRRARAQRLILEAWCVAVLSPAHGPAMVDLAEPGREVKTRHLDTLTAEHLGRESGVEPA